MSKKKKKCSWGNMRNLNVQSFLEKYYGISHEGISSMTHKVASSFFPQLKRASFDYIQKNPELVSTGKIVLVEDVEHFMAPYFMPEEPVDTLTGCDERERTIKQIVDTFDQIKENNLEGLLIVEGDDSVDSYLYHPSILHNRFLEYGCLGEMMDATMNHTGLFLRNNGDLVGYEVLSHGNNTYRTMQLSPLTRQAVGLTGRTDAIAIVFEDDILKLIVDGAVNMEEDGLSLQKDLLGIFPYAPMTTKEEEVTTSIVPPDTYTFANMPVYELEQLMHVYRASGQAAYYHIVRRELVKRTKSSKEFRREKEKLKIKEMEEGEES